MKWLMALLGLAYFTLRVVQMFAIAAGLTGSLHIPSILSFPGAFVLTWLPVIGSLLGAYGATTSWGWSFFGGFLFFASPLLAFGLMVGVAAIFDRARDRLRNSSSNVFR